ncbi:DUF4864 domain-containing protein [Pelagibius sp. Alg239-R121]|uniref:DUF4864 domain-containing protein n=1 Tax=Pelagibius sp. Alg239-R121 TaxID=2993448 RepID=UPI0024A6ED3B|nr:DUF4864 domain-containing protein [Pelagibius sp. Alg239-R121]
MLQRLFLIFSLVLIAPGAGANAAEADIPAGEKAAIKSVIESQLAAFKADDGQTAFSFASPTIKQLFGTPERFMSMVRSGYPAVYRPRAVEFRKLHRDGTVLVQEIRFIGPDGKPVIALYSVVQAPGGQWLIDGVVTVPAPEQSI